MPGSSRGALQNVVTEGSLEMGCRSKERHCTAQADYLADGKGRHFVCTGTKTQKICTESLLNKNGRLQKKDNKSMGGALDEPRPNH